jgi:hypothetical protein
MPFGAALSADKDVEPDRIFGREEAERTPTSFAEFRHLRSLDFGEFDWF